MINYLLIPLSVLLALLGFLIRRGAKKHTDKKGKKQKLWGTIIAVAGLYLLTTRLITLIFGAGEKEPFNVEIWAERTELFGFDISVTVICTWIVMAVLIVLALILRIFLIPRMKEIPRGAQNVIETCVEFIGKYTGSQTSGLGDGLTSYIFTVAAFLVGCAALELLGLRAPTADITLTFALALVTFFLINYYGIKKKGVGGRLKSMAQPTPVVFPMKVISDIAIPVSMACRLFGNMLGGMIVMDLIYFSLGNNAVGIPSVVGLYFNVFHPLIQAFIFVTLTLTFINEATE